MARRRADLTRLLLADPHRYGSAGRPRYWQGGPNQGATLPHPVYDLDVENVQRISRRLASLLRRHLFNLWLNGFVSSGLVPDHLRWVLLRFSGLTVKRSIVEAGGFVGSTKITIGRMASINRRVFLDGSAGVTIEDDVSIGMNVLVITGSHDLGGSERRAGELTTERVIIERGAWIGAGSIILPGVTIGRGAVVGAGSVVMKDVPPDSVVMGNPARLIRRLNDPA